MSDESKRNRVSRSQGVSGRKGSGIEIVMIGRETEISIPPDTTVDDMISVLSALNPKSQLLDHYVEDESKRTNLIIVWQRTTNVYSIRRMSSD